MGSVKPILVETYWILKNAEHNPVIKMNTLLRFGDDHYKVAQANEPTPQNSSCFGEWVS